ncbi:MAG: hypothetical protein ACP5UA_13350 [Candidatus Hydrogenedens sp.]
MKYKIVLSVIVLLSMIGSVYGGYKITRFLFTNYAKPFSIPSEELNDYEDLWLSVSILSDILTEYNKRMKEKGNAFALKEREWIIHSAQPTLQKIKEKILEKQNQKRQRSEKVEILFRQIQYLSERINTMFQFPADESLKKAVFADFYQYLCLLHEYIEQKKLQRLIPTSRIVVRFQKNL